MATPVKIVYRPLVTLSLPTAVPALISYTQSILKRMTGNAYYANPSPTLAAITAAMGVFRPFGRWNSNALLGASGGGNVIGFHVVSFQCRAKTSRSSPSCRG